MRNINTNKNYCYHNQRGVHSYMIQKAKAANRMDDFMGSSKDPCSVKKVGKADAANFVRNKKQIIVNDVDPNLFGVDSSNQFGPSIIDLRTVALASFEGRIDENGTLYRTAGRKRLDYSVSAPAWEMKCNAADMINVQEAIYTSNINESEEKLLLHKHKTDDFKKLPLKFRTEFLRFQLRMRMVSLLK